jgi:two-component system, OmpR family, sensor histidine kinase KdpD
MVEMDVVRKCMEHQRPDPDELLERVKAQEARKQRGRLKILLGAAAGVGKTYAMLQAAHDKLIEGVDVVVGYVEPHARPETEVLVKGLEVIPPLMVEYRGTQLRDFDLDAALKRHPKLILIDELAHTNAEGMRHTKRWQDVLEVLEAGINVYTTLNIQHIESLNDVVAQITGTIVRETVPDAIVEQADEIELIDLSPDDLLQRLREGKIYKPQQVEQAITSFFRRGNLMALRELSLRHTAAQVDEQMQVYRQDKAVEQIWPAGERIMVCISPSPLASRLVRAAKRMATGLHAEWITVYVETHRSAKLPENARNRVIQTLRLAEQLGAETVTLTGHNISEEILAYARKRNVTKIIVGKPAHAPWRDMLFGSVLNDLIRHSGLVDVYVISGEVDISNPMVAIRTSQEPIRWGLHSLALLVVLVCTLIASLMFPLFAPANLIMVYLVGIVFVATRYGRGASITASIASVLSFDFFFIPPYLTFHVSDTEYLITFAVMLLVGLVISSMTLQIQSQAESARDREQRSTSLYEMSREFASHNDVPELARIAAQHIEPLFDSQAVVFLSDNKKQFSSYGSAEIIQSLSEQEYSVTRWVYDHGQEAGLGTQTLPGSRGLYLPLLTPKGKTGVLGVYPRQKGKLFSPDQMHLLETLANQSAVAIERAQLADETEQARLQIETERMRSSLLSSVSHDLRTPLAAITGAVSSIVQRGETLDSHVYELAMVAYEEAERLNRLVGNLLQMTRLESGAVKVEKEWQPLEEVIGTTLLRLERLLIDHPLKTNLPDDLPLVPIDGVLIEQVLVNLLENAVKYTPTNEAIELSAWQEKEAVCVEIADHGTGIPTGEEEHIFDKFYRLRPTTASGVGLGLAISRAIIEAHGGHIWVINRAEGGAEFRFTLPLGEHPPLVDLEKDELNG